MEAERTSTDEAKTKSRIVVLGVITDWDRNLKRAVKSETIIPRFAIMDVRPTTPFPPTKPVVASLPSSAKPVSAHSRSSVPMMWRRS